MRLEFHQLQRRLKHLRVRQPERHRRLLPSLAASGHQTPIVVMAAGHADRYPVLDGCQRVAALEQHHRAHTYMPGRRCHHIRGLARMW